LSPPEGSATGSLVVEGVTKDFAGLRALDDVSLELATGEILGLIGPNGSGKTTLINVISGLLPATAGRVTLDGVTITGLPAHRVARAGIARTFQAVRLFRGLTVRENVEVAALGMGVGRAEARLRADELIEEFGLAAWSDVLAGTLPYGRERSLEMARALATGASFLLLDEPAAGLDEEEGDALLTLLAGMPAARGFGMLVIDHDMRLIMRLCRRLHVLASGRTIATGSADEIRRSPTVIKAYLGSEGAEA
jgi:branched-chain amino acid transport system ATP-binding protein